MPIHTVTCADCETPVRVREPDPATLPDHQCSLRRRRREIRAVEATLQTEVARALGDLLSDSETVARLAALLRVGCADDDEAVKRLGVSFRFAVRRALVDLED